MDDFTENLAENSPPLVGDMIFPEESSEPTRASSRRFAAGPILVSALLHAIGLYALVEFRIEAPKQASAERVVITMQLSPPLPVRSPEPSPSVPAVIEGAREVINSTPLPPESPSLPPPLVDLPQAPEPLVAVDLTPVPLPTPDSLTPTRLSVRQMVERLRSEEEQQAVIRVCTPLQKLNPMLLCADESSSGFDNALSDTSGGFFAANPANTDFAASQARNRRVANSLRESGMSQSDIDSYIEGFDVNSQQRNTSGDARANAVQDQMFRNDSTYQQMKRALNP